jgi:hypothetical protein
LICFGFFYYGLAGGAVTEVIDFLHIDNTSGFFVWFTPQ